LPLKNQDIVIIGAGPGGCAVSLFLAKYGIPHTILEKAIFPRDKVCGDALSGKTVYVLNKIDEKIVDDFSKKPDLFLPSWGVKFIAPNGKGIDIPFKSQISENTKAPGFISKRIDFDNEIFNLLDKNYANIIEQAEVNSIENDSKNGVSIFYKKDGIDISISNVKMIVGADGARSVVAKKLSDIKTEDEHFCAGIKSYYSGVTNMHSQNFIELHFLKELLPGYFWIFPLPNGMANVGAGMLSSSVKKHKVNLKENFLDAIKNNPTINHRFANAQLEGNIQGWGLPLGSKKRNISGDNFLLVGDAASLIDPFTGEGIGNAMYSGMLAAEHIKNSLEKVRFDSDFNKNYDLAFFNRQWDELKLSHTLQKLCKYPWLFNFVVNKAEKNKALRDTISCMFEDLDLRAKLRDPLFYLKLLINDKK